MTQFPPPPPGEEPPAPPDPPPAPSPPPAPAYAPPAYAPPAYAPPGAPQGTPADRVRTAWQQRHESDYIFSFWTAFGWTLLTLGFYSYYVIYQLVRRDRDHIRRRVELLDAATTFAWEQANDRGIASELTPAFERISAALAQTRAQTSEFRDPIIWMIIDIFTGGIGRVIAYVLMDGDLIRHDRAEGAVEAELSAIYERLGAPIPPPDPARVKGEHNYVGRIIVTLVTCGIYLIWWTYDVMVEWNRHFEDNWRWEDGLAASVQSLLPAQAS